MFSLVHVQWTTQNPNMVAACHCQKFLRHLGVESRMVTYRWRFQGCFGSAQENKTISMVPTQQARSSSIPHPRSHSSPGILAGILGCMLIPKPEPGDGFQKRSKIHSFSQWRCASLCYHQLLLNLISSCPKNGSTDRNLNPGSPQTYTKKQTTMIKIKTHKQ